MHRIRGLSVVLVVLATSACREKPVPASTFVADDASATATATASKPEAGPRATFVPDAGPRDGGSEDEVQRAEARYRDALARGRKATRTKAFSEARVAFGEALAVRPGDARATAERGYASYLDADLYAAAQDLEAASEATTDKKLLAQIWYNRGLVESDEANARVAFYLSNEYSPSDAAKKKLGSAKVCPVIVERGKSAAQYEGPVADITATTHAALKAAACKAMGSDACDANEEPWTPSPTPAVYVRDATGQSISYLVAKSAAGLRGYGVGAAWGGRCPGKNAFSVEKIAGSLVHVHGFELGESGYAYMCSKDDGEPSPCGAKLDVGQPGVSSMSFCAGGTMLERDVVIDVAKESVVLVVERPLLGTSQDPSAPTGPRVKAELVATGLAITGLGCDTIVPFVAASDGGAPLGRDAGAPADAGPRDAAR